MNENIPMNAHELELRSWLSAPAEKLFDDMYYCRALGAASNIQAIGGMYADLAANAASRALDTKTLCLRVQAVSDYFIEKRGASSHAIVTAIRIMTAALPTLANGTLSEACAALTAAYAEYQAKARGWTEKIMAYGWNIIAPIKSILLFDYSSTVNAMMQTAHAHGKTMDVYVPESRILDGGHQFLRNGASMGHRMHYLPDAALARFLPKVDAAFIGAETFFPDGSLANTVGSDLTALVCRACGTPLYVPTSLIKLDPRGFRGIRKQEIYEDASAYFGLHLEKELRERVDISVPGLVTVPAENVTAYITEVGVVPPAAMYQVSREFLRGIGEEA